MGFLRLDGRPGARAADVAAVRRWLASPQPDRLVVETSGSTGLPKRVVLSRAAVLASAVAAEERLGGPGRWVLALSPAYVAGLQVVVRSLLAGHEPLAGPQTGPEPGEGRLYTSVVPTQLSRLLDSDPAHLRGYDRVLVGGGSLDPGLRRRAEDAGVAVVPTYGMSETAGGCVYDGVPLTGVEVRIDSDTRVALRGPMLFEGYDGDPRLTREVLVDGWFRTEDLGEVTDGRLRILGRRDDVVVSGGINVPTPAVAARLRAHPAVRDVAVVGVDDAEWGQRVVAFVVGRLSLAEARDWVGQAHPRAWAPRELRLVPELPLLPTGKLDRVRLRAW